MPTHLKHVPLRSTELSDFIPPLASVSSDTKSPEFFRSAFHQLRTPLQVIQGMAELMEGEAPLDNWPTFAGVIRCEAAQMAAIFEDVGYRRDLEAERLTFQLRCFDVSSLVDELADTLEKFYPARLSIRYVSDLPPVFADARHLRAMLWLLLHNAARRSRDQARNKIELTVRERRRYMEFWVKDNGDRIPPAQRPLLFESANALLQHPHFGLGRGLFVIRKVARLLGGDLRYQSPTPKKSARIGGRGNVFVLSIPVAGGNQ